jgi:hypothetical protein
LEAKGHGIKNSITNLMNQLSCTLDAIIVLKYTSQGRALLLLVSKQNLKPFLGAFNTLRIIKNGLKMKTLWLPKLKGAKSSKKKPLNIIKAGF